MIRNKGVLTGSSYASMFFLGVGTVIIGAAAGSIGLSPYQTGLLVSAQNVGFICAVLIAGALADSTDKALGTVSNFPESPAFVRFPAGAE